MRLILHTAAYWLMLTVRDEIPCMQPLASGEFSTIRLRLLGRLLCRSRKPRSRIKLAFAANCPESCAVPWIDRRADPASNVNDGVRAPVGRRLINLQRLADMV